MMMMAEKYGTLQRCGRTTVNLYGLHYTNHTRWITVVVHVIIICCIPGIYCQRRIVNGTLSIGEPRYLVYFVESPKSYKEYKGWLCGGAIIHPLYILTSAACLDDVKYVYAIAGYNKYVKTEDVEKDECTKRTKNKVVARSYQKDVNENKNSSHWDYRDISLAKVEIPYDFRDPVYATYCSYIPSMIRVNYNNDFEVSGTQAVTFGWGHKKYYRLVGDTKDYNENFVNYASTVVMDKESCKKQLNGHDELKLQISLYLLCTSGPGSLDENGKITDIVVFNDTTNCATKKSYAHKYKDSEKVHNSLDTTSYFYVTKNMRKSLNNQLNYRKNGPCQNDHGGPLITWIGGREYIIGVACGFQVNNKMECVGPYLYTSTYSNGEFIYCILRFSRRSKLCSISPQQKGYQIIEEDIVWKDNVKTAQLRAGNL